MSRNRLELNSGTRASRTAQKQVTGRTLPITKEAAAQKKLQIEAGLDVALRSSSGLAKVAANLVNPVKRYLDYTPIWRQTAIVETIPHGQIMFFDRDIEEFTAAKLAEKGTTVMIECQINRVLVEPFVVAARPKIPYIELYRRKYDALKRAGERLSQSVGIKEDLLGLALYEALSTATNTVTIGTALSKAALARAFAMIEWNRLTVQHVITSAFGISGIRRWEMKDLTEGVRQTIEKTGYMGSLWGADFITTNKINPGVAYCLAAPENVAWMPMYKDFDLTPADDPDNLLLGFVGAEVIGMVAHNAWGVSKIAFSVTNSPSGYFTGLFEKSGLTAEVSA
jgi:hypothetical protein